MTQSPPYLSIRRLRVFTACLLSLLMLTAPMAPLAASVNRTNAARAEKKTAAKAANSAKQQATAGEARESALFVNPLPFAVGPIIGATMSDSFVDTAPVSGRADPGSIITYTANISNTGGAGATGVNFMDTVDPNTTLINASIKFSPIAVNDAYNGTQNTTLNISAPGVLTNDSGQPAPTAVAIAAGATTQGGTVTLNADGSFAYNPPNAGFTGTDTFTYSITNGVTPPSATDAQATVTITVSAPDTPPTAVNDSATVTEDAAATAINVLANDTDPDGGPKSVASVTQPTNGSVVITGGGTGLTYQPNADYCNNPPGTTPDTFTYTLTPGSSTATVTVTVTCVDDPPVAVNDSATVNEDSGANAINVLANDTDVDGGPKSVASVTQPANGAVVITGGGTGLTYQPAANYCNQPPGTTPDTFTYTLTPGSSTATVSVTVTCVDDPPVAVNDSATVVEDSGANAINVLANDTDIDGGPKSVGSVTQPANGAVVITGGGTGLTYQPNANYCNNPPGTTPDTFTYTLTPGSSTATVSVLVTCVDDAPVAVNDSATVNEDSGANAISVLANDTDIDGGPKSVASVTQPTNGAVVITGGGTGLTYQPNANYCNNPPGTTPDTFTYTLTPGSSTATVSVTVTCVNDAPVLTSGGGSPNFTEDGPAVAIDPGILVTDIDNATLASATIQITGNLQTAEDVLAFTNDGSTMGNITAAAYVPATGLLTLTSASSLATLAEWQNALRVVTYADTSQNPSALARTVTFRVNDGALNSNAVTKNVTVTPVNDAPVLAAIEGGALTYTENDAPTSVTLTMTLTDVDSANMTGATVQITGNFQSSQDVLSFVNTPNITGVYNSANGTMTLSGTDTKANYQTALRAVKYNNTSDDPNTTTRTVTFQVNDGGAVNNLSNTQTRNITVVAVNDPPTAFGFTGLSAQAGIPITYPAGKLGGTDLEAGTTITIDTVPINVINGTVVINANGLGGFTFTPLPGTAGGTNNASFQYRVSDNGNPGPGVNGLYVTVSFNPAGPAIYFTKSVAVGSGNCTLGNECTIATAVTTIGASTNANIFIEDANTQSPGNITLNSGGWIIGQGVTGVSFDNFFGIGSPAQGTLAARPSINQSRPTISGASTITAHNNSQMRGFNYTPSGNGLAATGRTGLVVSDMNITSTSNSAAQFAVNFGTSSGTFTFGDVTVTSPNAGSAVNFATIPIISTVAFNNISTTTGKAFVASSTGTTNFTFNDVTSTTGTAVDLNTGSGAFTFHAINANGAGTGILVQGIISGSFTVNGTSTTAGTGGTIQNCTNKGADFRSSSNVTLKNMNFTNNATANLGAATTCGDALNATNGPTNCNSNVSLLTVTTATLNNVTATGSKQIGIDVNGGSGLTLTNVTATGNGNEVGEDGVQIANSTGTLTVTNGLFKDNAANQFEVQNGSGALTVNVSGATFSNTTFPVTASTPSNTTSNSGLFLATHATATMSPTITICTVDRIYAQGIRLDMAGSSSMNANVGPSAGAGSGNTITNSNQAISITGSNTGGMTYNVRNNTTNITVGVNPDAGATNQIGVNRSTASGTWTGLIENNTTGTAGNANSGCQIAGCDAIDITNNSAGTHKLTIKGNTIHDTEGSGIVIISGGAPDSSSVSWTVQNNTVTNPDQNAGAANPAIIIQSGTSIGTDNTNTCLNISGNTTSGTWSLGTGHLSSIRVRSLTTGAGSFSIVGFVLATNYPDDPTGVVGSTTGPAGDIGNVADYIRQQNPGVTNASPGQSAASANKLAASPAFSNSAGCPLLLGLGGISSAREMFPLLTGFNGGAFTVPSLERAMTPAAGTSDSLSQPELDSVRAEAIERWASTGLTPGQMATLRGIKFEVSDLYGAYLGESNDRNIQIDRNAGGMGWYIGSDASSDSLFSRAVSTTRRYTDPLSAPAGHLDLLTAIEHEMGHKLGLDDSYAEKDRDNLMYGYLTVGERRLPAPGQAKYARLSENQGTQHLKLRSAESAGSRRAATLSRRSDNPITPLAGGTVNATIGTLPAGKSVTITFQVTLNAAMPSGTSTVTTQGTVSGGNFASVLTDDQPGTAAPNEPTVTPIDAPTAAESTVSGQIVDGNGNPVEGAGIRMSGTQNRLTVTDANGNYHFDNVETNGFYTVVPSRANFNFSPSQRSFSALGQTTDAAFNASPTGNALNPLDTTEYFVRQQYVDFLGREPDEAGLNFWYNNIESCGNDDKCRAGKRIDTSAAFFLSIEFQETGYLVFRTYQSAFGDMPGAPVPIRLVEFKPDTAEIGNGVVVNQTGWEGTLEQNKVSFMADFVQRPRFSAAYAATLSPPAFVDQLFAKAGVIPADVDRTAAIAEFGSASTSSDVAARGRALRRVAENSTLAQQEVNQAFVLIQYFGYLRRDPNSGPDANFSGYNFWLDKLNTFNGNFGDAEMVKSFLVSGEYRGRFPR